MRTVSLVRTIRTVLGAVTDLVWRNTLRGGALPHVEVTLRPVWRIDTVSLITAITAVSVSVTEPGRVDTAPTILALEL